MANPQVEDGFTKIANELYEALIGFKCNGSVKDFVHAVIRETYGYLSTDKKIPASRIAELLKVTERRVRTVRKIAIKSGMISYKNGVYSVVKNYENWVPYKPDVEADKTGEPEPRSTENDVEPRSTKKAEPRGTTKTEPRSTVPSIYKKSLKKKKERTTFQTPQISASGDELQNKLDLGISDPPEQPAKTTNETPAQQAIRHAYETLLSAPLKTGKGYNGLTELISTHGIPVVYEWVAAIGSITVPEGANAWKHFCVRFREIARRWEWENKTNNFNQPQPTRLTQEAIDNIQNANTDEYGRPI